MSHRNGVISAMFFARVAVDQTKSPCNSDKGEGHGEGEIEVTGKDEYGVYEASGKDSLGSMELF